MTALIAQEPGFVVGSRVPACTLLLLSFQRALDDLDRLGPEGYQPS